MKNYDLENCLVVELEANETKLINGGGFWEDLGYFFGSLHTGPQGWDTPGVVAYNTSSYAK